MDAETRELTKDEQLLAYVLGVFVGRCRAHPGDRRFAREWEWLNWPAHEYNRIVLRQLSPELRTLVMNEAEKAEVDHLGEAGWLSQAGRIHWCRKGDHCNLARSLGHSEPELEADGWVKICSPWNKPPKFGKPWCMGEGRRPNMAQRNMLCSMGYEVSDED